MKSIYYHQSDSPNYHPIVVIGSDIDEVCVEYLELLLKKVGITTRNIKQKTDKDLLEFINCLNLIRNFLIKTEEDKPSIRVYMRVIGSYDIGRYGFVSLKRACEHLAFILREEWGDPPITVSGNREWSPLYESKSLTRGVDVITDNLSTLVSYSYGRILHKVYKEMYG